MISKINRKLLPLKFLSFFLFAAIGCLPAFINVHMTEIGLSHEEITWINTVLPLIGLVGPPTVGYIVDRFANHRLIAIISMFLAAVFHTSLLFVPPREPMTRPDLQMVCNGRGSFLVLQSCGQACPSSPTSPGGTYTIQNCRSACGFIPDHCDDPTISSRRTSNTSVSPAVESEVSLGDHFIPNICLHHDSSVECNELPYNETMKINVDSLVALPHAKLDPFPFNQSCCQFPLRNFNTSDIFYFSLTCPSSQNCPVICSMEEKAEKSQYVLQSPKCSSPGSNPKTTLWIYFFLRTSAEMFPAILISLFDAVALTMVGQYGGDFGRQKMFGLFAVGTSSPLVGYLMDEEVGVFGGYKYSPVFYGFDILLFVTAIIMLFLPLKGEVHRSNMLKNVAQLVRNGQFAFLLFLVTLLGALNGYLETFLYIYLSKVLKANKFLIGLTVTVGILPSVPFLYKSDKIVDFCGHHYLLMLAFLGYCVRFAGLSYIANPYWVIPLEMLELFTINLMQVSAVTLAYKLAPKQLVATAQGLIWISHFDIGRAIGTIIGGYLISVYGDVRVFQMASVLSVVCCAIYLLCYQIIQYRREHRPPTPPPKKSSATNGHVMNGNYIPLQQREDNPETIK